MWPTLRFKELASPRRWSFSIGPFGSKVTTADYRVAGVPFVRGVNLASGIFVDDDFVYIDEDKADEVLSANVESGDLVFTRKGTIGQVSMIPRDARFTRYVISGSQVKARLDPEIASPEFYYYWFRSPAGQHALFSNTVTVGVPSLANSLDTLRNIEVPHPPLDEQRGIAAVLGALDDKITVNGRIATTYEKLLQEKFTAIGAAAEGDHPITEIIDFNPRSRRLDAKDAVYVDMAALPTRTSSIRTWTHRAPKGGSRFQNGDTLLARITPCLENGKTGYVDFLADGEIATGSTEFIVMRSREGVPPEISYFVARDRRFRENAIRRMVGSSGRQRVSASDAADFFVRKPDHAKLAAFGAEASAAFRLLRSVTEESLLLESLRNTLLPELMSGRMRVTDVEKVVEEAV